MCHHLLGPFQFGPNVNFIVGNNGSKNRPSKRQRTYLRVQIKYPEPDIHSIVCNPFKWCQPTARFIIQYHAGVLLVYSNDVHSVPPVINWLLEYRKQIFIIWSTNCLLSVSLYIFPYLPVWLWCDFHAVISFLLFPIFILRWKKCHPDCFDCRSWWKSHCHKQRSVTEGLCEVWW